MANTTGFVFVSIIVPRHPRLWLHASLYRLCPYRRTTVNLFDTIWCHDSKDRRRYAYKEVCGRQYLEHIVERHAGSGNRTNTFTVNKRVVKYSVSSKDGLLVIHIISYEIPRPR